MMKSSIYGHPQFFKINSLVLHKIKDIQNCNTLYTSNCPIFIIPFMTNETYWNCTKFIVMKIHKYTNNLKVILSNYNPYNSCNHSSKSWGCKILFVYMQSLVPFIMNAPNNIQVYGYCVFYTSFANVETCHIFCCNAI